MEQIKERLDKINKITASNEFWALGSGDHLNMIDTLTEDIEHLIAENKKYKRLAQRSKDIMNESFKLLPKQMLGTTLKHRIYESSIERYLSDLGELKE